jgi:two-component system, NarL family, nitrate/nitrite response regulator NarL
MATRPLPQIRLLVSDNNTMSCRLLADALRRAKFEITGCAVTVPEILSSIARDAPDIAIVSGTLHEKRLAGFVALREIGMQFPNVRVLILLHDPDRELVVSAFRGGARGVFFRADPFAQLCKCLRVIHQGQIWASTQDLHYLVDALAKAVPLRHVSEGVAALLTKREEELVGYVAQGLSNREIAQAMFLSEHTVKNYLFRIFDKLGISSRVELVLHCTGRTMRAS